MDVEPELTGVTVRTPYEVIVAVATVLFGAVLMEYGVEPPEIAASPVVPVETVNAEGSAESEVCASAGVSLLLHDAVNKLLNINRNMPMVTAGDFFINTIFLNRIKPIPFPKQVKRRYKNLP